VRDEAPDARRVAARAVVLACVVARASVEYDAAEHWAPTAAERAWRIARRRASRREAEEHELALLAVPLGELADGPRIDGTWRIEGVAVLAWALSRFELPASDDEADTNEVMAALGMSDGDVDVELLARATLRPRAEIERLAEELLAAHRRLHERGADPEIESILVERRLAAGWLLGEAELYSEVQLET
jgi:hypothetical protein